MSSTHMLLIAQTHKGSYDQYSGLDSTETFMALKTYTAMSFVNRIEVFHCIFEMLRFLPFVNQVVRKRLQSRRHTFEYKNAGSFKVLCFICGDLKIRLIVLFVESLYHFQQLNRHY